MKDERDLEIEIQRILLDAEEKWDYTVIRDIRRNMLRAIEFIDKKYPDSEEINMLEVLGEYQKDKEEYNRKNKYGGGYFFIAEVVDEFVNNPEIIWKIYDDSENKEDFFIRKEFEYTYSKEENLYAFSRELLSGYFMDRMWTVEDVEKLTREQRINLVKSSHMFFGQKFKPEQEMEERKNLVETLRNIHNELIRLGALEENRKAHNEKMIRAGATILTIPEEIEAMDDLGNFYGINLNELPIFKLQALLAFYTNRLEKVKESVGLGMFLVTVFSKEEDFYKESMETLNEEKLKTAWKRFYAMSRILDDEMDVIYEESIKKKLVGNRTELQVDEVYETVFEKYSNVWQATFGDIDMRDEFFIFMTTNGFSKNNHYILKDRLLEELIPQCMNENFNWGIIDESEGSRAILTKRILIGMDIPGMNMSLRLHDHLKKVKTIVVQRQKSTEVPIYVGNEDFTYMGKNIGAEIYTPIDTKKSNWLKNVIRDKKQKPSNMLKHIACMQLPNMVKKLYDKKYFKRGEGIKKDVPDFIDLETSKIRKTGKMIEQNNLKKR